MNRARQSILEGFRRFLRPDNKESRQLAWIILALILIAAIAANNLPQGRLPQAQTTPTAGTKQAAYPPPPSPDPTGQAAYPAPSPTATINMAGQNETDGMIIGGVLLVLIIIGGTLQVLRPRSQE
jgi:hypothetical protein